MTDPGALEAQAKLLLAAGRGAEVEAMLRPIFGAYTTSIRLAATGDGSDELGRERPAFREHDPRGVVAGQVTLKLRYTDFHTISRARTISPTSVDVELHRVVLELLEDR